MASALRTSAAGVAWVAWGAWVARVLLLAGLASNALAQGVVGQEPPPVLAGDVLCLSALDEEVQLYGAERRSVTATLRAERTVDVAANVYVLSRGEIEQLQPNDLGDLLYALPALDTFRLSNRTFGVGPAGLAHFRSNQYIVLVDGIPVPTARAGGADWSALPVPIDQIERVEYVAGPQSALYGPYAGSGVINVITRRANPSTWSAAAPSSASLRVGESGYLKAAVAANAERGATALTAWATWRAFEGFGTPTWPVGQPIAGGQEGDGARDLLGGVSVERRLDSHRRLRFDGSVSTSDFQSLLPNDAGRYYDTDSRATLASLVYTDAQAWNRQFTLTLKHQFERSELSEPLYGPFGRTETEDRFQDLQAEARQTFMGAHGQRYVLGLNHTRRQGSGVDYETGEHSATDTALFGLAQLPLSGRDTALLGLSGLHASLTGDAFTYSVAMLHRFDRNQVARLIYSTGVREPDLKTRFFHELRVGPSVFFESGPELENERFGEWQLGYERHWRRTGVKADLFSLEVRDQIGVVNRNPFGLPRYAFLNEAGTTEMQGVDVSVDRRLSRAWSATLAARRVLKADSAQGGERSYTPDWKLYLKVDWRPAKDWSVTLVGRSVDDYLTVPTAGGRLEGYGSVDLVVKRAVGRSRRGDVWLKVENLFDDVHHEMFTDRLPGGAELGRLATVGYCVRF